MGDPRWCRVCSDTGIGFDGDYCLCRIGAFEAQQKPEPVYTVAGDSIIPETMENKWKGFETKKKHQIPQSECSHMHLLGANESFPKHCESCGIELELPNPESLPDVTYIPVAPDDHAELIRKSDLYNECKAVIDRLSCEIEDLKRRFV